MAYIFLQEKLPYIFSYDSIQFLVCKSYDEADNDGTAAWSGPLFVVNSP